jgi:hypothetical protein
VWSLAILVLDLRNQFCRSFLVKLSELLGLTLEIASSGLEREPGELPPLLQTESANHSLAQSAPDGGVCVKPDAGDA